MKQITSHIMMVRPYKFRLNDQTAVNNYYQTLIEGLSEEQASEKAQQEFDDFVEMLKNAGINVYVFQDDEYPDTPDAVFPNNWVSFHEDGRVVMYPMFAGNRRNERREEIFDILADDFGFQIKEVADLRSLEDDNMILEGTGVLILDRQNKLAYVALSERADRHALETFCDHFDYEPVIFHAFQNANGERLPIYHTNVMMCLGRAFSVICLNSIDSVHERKKVVESLKSSGKKVIEITEAQKENFAGNMLNVANEEGQEYCVMSTAAYKALRPDQIEAIEKHAKILHSSLNTIEALGGGSARCMMAEIFLPKNTQDAN